MVKPFEGRVVKTLIMYNRFICLGSRDITPFTREIGTRARNAGFNVICFSSERGTGANIVIFKDFDRLLRPKMIVPSSEFDPELDFNYYNGMGR